MAGNLASAYRQSDRKGKTRMLDEFVRQTGYNRKYALHMLTRWGQETFLTVGGNPVKRRCLHDGPGRYRVRYETYHGAG